MIILIYIDLGECSIHQALSTVSWELFWGKTPTVKPKLYMIIVYNLYVQ